MQKKMIFIISMLLIPLSGLGVDLYAPSIPAISLFMHSGHSLAKFTMSVYLIGFAVGQCVCGVASDSWGRKPVLVIGLFVFLFASFAAIFAKNIYLLIFFRLVQGISAPAASVNAKTLLSDTFTGKDFKIAMSYLVTFYALGQVIGPIIGSYLQHYFNWQANFMFYCGYGFLLLSLVVLCLKETHTDRHSFSLLTVRSHVKILLLDRRFMCGVLQNGLVYALFVVFPLMTTFLVQVELRLPATSFGRIAILAGVCFFVGTMTARVLLQHMTAKRMIEFGLGFMVVAILVALFVVRTIPLSLIAITIPTGLLLFFAGIITPVLVGTLLSFYPGMAGTANAVLGLFIGLVALVVTAVLSVIAIGTLFEMMLCYGSIVLLTALTYFVGWSRADLSPAQSV